MVDTGRRRRWSEDEKLKIVLESLQAPRQVAATARRYGISRSLLLRWRRSFQPEPKDAAQTYLRERCITVLHGTGNLRFHPRRYYRPDEHSPAETWPAMIAAVTGLSGAITGAHRTWLVRDGFGNPRAHVILCAARSKYLPGQPALWSMRAVQAALLVMREQTLATPSIPRAVHAGIHVAALSFRLQEPSSRFLPLARKSASVQDNGSGSAGEEPHRDSHS